MIYTSAEEWRVGSKEPLLVDSKSNSDSNCSRELSELRNGLGEAVAAEYSLAAPCAAPVTASHLPGAYQGKTTSSICDEELADCSYARASEASSQGQRERESVVSFATAAAPPQKEHSDGDDRQTWLADCRRAPADPSDCVQQKIVVRPPAEYGGQLAADSLSSFSQKQRMHAAVAPTLEPSYRPLFSSFSAGKHVCKAAAGAVVSKDAGAAGSVHERTVQTGVLAFATPASAAVDEGGHRGAPSASLQRKGQELIKLAEAAALGAEHQLNQEKGWPPHWAAASLPLSDEEPAAEPCSQLHGSKLLMQSQQCGKKQFFWSGGCNGGERLGDCWTPSSPAAPSSAAHGGASFAVAVRETAIPAEKGDRRRQSCCGSFKRDVGGSEEGSRQLARAAAAAPAGGPATAPPLFHATESSSFFRRRQKKFVRKVPRSQAKFLRQFERDATADQERLYYPVHALCQVEGYDLRSLYEALITRHCYVRFADAQSSVLYLELLDYELQLLEVKARSHECFETFRFCAVGGAPTTVPQLFTSPPLLPRRCCQSSSTAATATATTASPRHFPTANATVTSVFSSNNAPATTTTTLMTTTTTTTTTITTPAAFSATCNNKLSGSSASVAPVFPQCAYPIKSPSPPPPHNTTTNATIPLTEIADDFSLSKTTTMSATATAPTATATAPRLLQATTTSPNTKILTPQPPPTPTTSNMSNKTTSNNSNSSNSSNSSSSSSGPITTTTRIIGTPTTTTTTMARSTSTPATTITTATTTTASTTNSTSITGTTTSSTVATGIMVKESTEREVQQKQERLLKQGATKLKNIKTTTTSHIRNNATSSCRADVQDGSSDYHRTTCAKEEEEAEVEDCETEKYGSILFANTKNSENGDFNRNNRKNGKNRESSRNCCLKRSDSQCVCQEQEHLPPVYRRETDQEPLLHQVFSENKAFPNENKSHPHHSHHHNYHNKSAFPLQQQRLQSEKSQPPPTKHFHVAATAAASYKETPQTSLSSSSSDKQQSQQQPKKSIYHSSPPTTPLHCPSQIHKPLLQQQCGKVYNSMQRILQGISPPPAPLEQVQQQLVVGMEKKPVEQQQQLVVQQVMKKEVVKQKSTKKHKSQQSSSVEVPIEKKEQHLGEKEERGLSKRFGQVVLLEQTKQKHKEPAVVLLSDELWRNGEKKPHISPQSQQQSAGGAVGVVVEAARSRERQQEELRHFLLLQGGDGDDGVDHVLSQKSPLCVVEKMLEEEVLERAEQTERDEKKLKLKFFSGDEKERKSHAGGGLLLRRSQLPTKAQQTLDGSFLLQGDRDKAGKKSSEKSSWRRSSRREKINVFSGRSREFPDATQLSARGKAVDRKKNSGRSSRRSNSSRSWRDSNWQFPRGESEGAAAADFHGWKLDEEEEEEAGGAPGGHSSVLRTSRSCLADSSSFFNSSTHSSFSVSMESSRFCCSSREDITFPSKALPAPTLFKPALQPRLSSAPITRQRDPPSSTTSTTTTPISFIQAVGLLPDTAAFKPPTQKTPFTQHTLSQTRYAPTQEEQEAPVLTAQTVTSSSTRKAPTSPSAATAPAAAASAATRPLFSTVINESQSPKGSCQKKRVEAASAVATAPAVANLEEEGAEEALTCLGSASESCLGAAATAESDEIVGADLQGAEQPSCCFIFANGAVVVWGGTGVEGTGVKREMLSSLLWFLNKFHTALVRADMSQEDVMFYCYIEEFRRRFPRMRVPKGRVKQNRLYLKTRSSEEKLAASYAIAQSIRLDVYEAMVNFTIAQVREIPERMSRFGCSSLAAARERRLFTGAQSNATVDLYGRQFADLSVKMIDVNLVQDFLDVPGSFWEDDTWQPFWQRVHNHLELQERIELLNTRYACILELLKVVRRERSRSQAFRLTWIVVLLLVAQVIATALKFFVFNPR